MSSPRWWCRKILNSLLPTYTSNLQLHMEQFPLKTNWKLAEELLFIKGEKGHIEVDRRLGWGSCQKSHLWCSDPQIRRDLTNPELLPEKQKICTPHHTLQLLRPLPERWAPKTSGFNNQWGPGAVVTWETNAQIHLPQCPVQRQQFGKYPDYMWMRFIC